jgi:hypothetical protein
MTPTETEKLDAIVRLLQAILDELKNKPNYPRQSR